MHLLTTELYTKSLCKIHGYKFTPREIDVIACILHNRGEKKIAFILGISPNTVNTHISNIMNKFGVNSREYIVDFIEKNGKVDCIKKYYFYLLVGNLLKEYLIKIGKLKQCLPTTCSIKYNINIFGNEKILKTLNICLNYTNISLVHIENNIDIHKKSIILIEDLMLIDEANLSTSIYLLYNKTLHNKTKESEYIDFSNHKDFHFSVLELIDKIHDKLNLSKIIKDFTKDYESLSNSYQNKQKLKSIKSYNMLPVFTNNRYKILSIIGVITLILATTSVLYRKNLSSYIHNCIYCNKEKKLEIIEINKKFAEYAKIFTANSNTLKARQANYKLLNKVKHLVDYLKNEEILAYYYNPDIEAEELISCTYLLQCLAYHYIYNDHNGKESVRLLHIAQGIIEKYIIKKAH